MTPKIRPYLFIAIAFLLGSINLLYHSIFLGLMLIVFSINIVADWKMFLENVRKVRRYLILPIVAVLYCIIHYLIMWCLGRMTYQVSWSIIELLLLYFFFIPLFVISAKSFVTTRLLRHFLLGLCWGILAFNTVKFFYITESQVFTEPMQALLGIYAGRFGGNLFFFNGLVLLEAQAIYLAVAAIIAYSFILQSIYERSWKLIFWSSIIIFIFSLLFLSFTITKGSILAFFVGFLVLSIVYLKKFSFMKRVIVLGGIVFLFLGVYTVTPNAVIDRLNSMKVEVIEVKEGGSQGGSIGSRVALWKESFEHFDEWGVYGLGLYKKYGVREWYQSSQYTSIQILRNPHNSFLDFWLLGGIPGLLFICFYFFAPILKMISQRKYSYLIVALVITLFIANNTCLLITLMDSNPMMIFIFSLSFLYLDDFVKIERKSEQALKIKNKEV